MSSPVITLSMQLYCGEYNGSVTHLDEVDAVFSTESLDQLDVHGLVAAVGQNAQMSSTFVQGLGRLVQSPRKTIVDEGGLQDLLQSGVNVHRTTSGGSDRGGGGGVISEATQELFTPLSDSKNP
jgi:hypothetical protein